jgi:Methane oxygenase PmoA
MIMNRKLAGIIVLSFGVLPFVGIQLNSQEKNSEPRPFPELQAVPMPYHQVSFQRGAQEITRAHFSPSLYRPFIFPVIGPSGRLLTRMGHPHDPESHSHHNSVWISHADVNGVDFWSDRGQGRIIHDRVLQLDDGLNQASLLTLSAWTSSSGKVLLQERRQLSVQLLPRDEWILIIDLQLDSRGDPVTLGKTPFGMVGVRVAKTIGVNDGKGTIRNSEKGVNEAGIFWKRAKWVDYSGQTAQNILEGITLMDHPSNPNHPTFFHVRNDGWMGCSLTLDGPRTIQVNQPLRLRYGIYIHSGIPSIEILQERWNTFANTTVPDLTSRSK